MFTEPEVSFVVTVVVVVASVVPSSPPHGTHTSSPSLPVFEASHHPPVMVPRGLAAT